MSALLGSLQLQDQGQWVEMFTLDLTDLGGPLYRFVPDTNHNRQPIIWQGNTFNPIAIEVTGFGMDSEGRPSRPKAKIGNVGGEISALMLVYDDLLGAALYRHRTKVMYLDAANFPPQRNLVTYSETLSAWTLTGVSAAQDSTLSPMGEAEPVWKLTKLDTSTSASCYRTLNVPEDNITQTATVRLRAGSSTTAEFGLYQGGWAPRVSARIAEGPGTIADGTTTLVTVSGLSDSEWTTVEVLGTVTFTEATSLYFYPGGSASTTVGDSMYVCYPQVENGDIATDYQKVAGAVWDANPDADPAEHLPDDLYYINQVVGENYEMVEFELTSPLELDGLQIPARVIQPVICTLDYRGEGCNYSGPAVADKYDNPTGDINKDSCSRTMKGCKLRFPPPMELSFGAWPAAAKIPQA